MSADHQHIGSALHGDRPALLMHLFREHHDVDLNRIDDLAELVAVHEAAHASTPDLWLARCDHCPWHGDYPTSRAQAERDEGRHVMREHSPGRAI